MSVRKNFSFRYDWAEKIAHLPEKVQFEILTGTVAYAQSGVFPESSAEAREAFEEHILPDFRKRAKAAEYRARAKARKAAMAQQAQPASEPGEPKQPQTAEPETKVEKAAPEPPTAPTAVPTVEAPAAARLSSSARRRLLRARLRK